MLLRWEIRLSITENFSSSLDQMEVNQSKREDKQKILPDLWACEISHDEMVVLKEDLGLPTFIYNELAKGAGSYYS